MVLGQVQFRQFRLWLWLRLRGRLSDLRPAAELPCALLPHLPNLVGILLDVVAQYIPHVRHHPRAVPQEAVAPDAAPVVHTARYGEHIPALVQRVAGGNQRPAGQRGLENRLLYEDIAVRGLILSEYPPGTGHKGSHFPVRNRIISGLSVGVIVVEAPRRSGALITASRALDQGREVFAVPGPIYDPRCEGSNRLLEEGAHPALHAWGVLSCYANRFPQKIRAQRGDLPRRFGQNQKTEKSARPEEPVHTPRPERREPPDRPVLVLSGDHGLTDDQIRLVKALRGRTAQADELIEETGIPARRALSALTVLELDEIVTQDAGKQFSLAVTLK